MKPLSVFCYGEVGLDNIIQADSLPSPEIAVFPEHESYHIGGAAANTGVWLAHMGVPTGVSGNMIGDDLYGRQLRTWLEQHEQLDLSALQIVPGLTTPFTRAIVTPDGERSFLIFYYPKTPKSTFTLEMMRGAHYLALDLYGGPERLNAAKAAHAAGLETTIGDVIWPEHEALPVTSIVTNSGSYIRNVFPGVDVRAHARKLQAINKGIVITTDGGEEVFAIDRDGSAFSTQPPKVTVVDATGAGDAFRAGLLYGLNKGLNLAESVCWGMATGSLKVGQVGAATTLPDFSEIESLANSLIVQGVQAC